MKKKLIQWIRTLDFRLATRQMNALGKKPPHLLILTFHGIFCDRRELAAAWGFPHEGMTVETFRILLTELCAQHYTFISSENLHDLAPDGQYVMLTFDDGYYNNHLILPILKEFGAVATCAITSNFVESQQPFWWDIHFQIRNKQGLSMMQILTEQNYWKQKPHGETEAFFQTFAFEQNDSNRPFDRNELQAFAQSPYIVLANHTHNHVILPNVSPTTAQTEIADCQNYLQEITSKRPTFIAYPNGDFDPNLIPILQAEGLCWGATVQTGWHKLSDLHLKFSLNRVTISGSQHPESLRSQGFSLLENQLRKHFD